MSTIGADIAPGIALYSDIAALIVDGDANGIATGAVGKIVVPCVVIVVRAGHESECSQQKR